MSGFGNSAALPSPGTGAGPIKDVLRATEVHWVRPKSDDPWALF